MSFTEIYLSLPENIEKVDSCRYLFLREYGGVYHDSDFEVTSKGLWDVLPGGVGLVESPYKYNEEVQNSLMSSEVGHPFWDDVLDEVRSRCCCYVCVFIYINSNTCLSRRLSLHCSSLRSSQVGSRSRAGYGVLQTTGPGMLTAVLRRWTEKSLVGNGAVKKM